MPRIAKKDLDLIAQGIRKYQPLLLDEMDKDINKSDTIILITDILHDVFGFNKYKEIQSDYFIRNTFCDFALYFEKNIIALMEVKAVGIPLKYEHIKRVRSYACTKDIEFAILTNGNVWNLYECSQDKLKDKEPTLSIKFSQVEPDEKIDLKKVFAFTQKGLKRAIAKELGARQELLDRHIIGALLLSDNFISTLKKDLRKIDSALEVDNDELEYLVRNEILKRDIIENEALNRAVKIIKDANYKINMRPKSTRPIKPRAKLPATQIATEIR